MKLQFGLLADHATLSVGGKLILVGVFDNVMIREKTEPVPIPTCDMVLRIEAHVTEGSDHTLRIHLVTEDGDAVIKPIEAPLKFQMEAPGRPMIAGFIMKFQDLKVPHLGDYSFDILVDGHHLGGVPMYVLPVPGEE